MANSIGSVAVEAHACGGGSGGLATGGPLRSHGGPSRRHRQTVESSHGEKKRRHHARPHPIPKERCLSRPIACFTYKTQYSRKEALQLLGLLAVTRSRKSYPYGRSLNIIIIFIYWGCLGETAPPETAGRAGLCCGRARRSSASSPGNLRFGDARPESALQ